MGSKWLHISVRSSHSPETAINRTFALLSAASVAALTMTTSTGDLRPASAAVSPRIAVAGDIACAPNHPDFNGGLGRNQHCRQKATSDLLGGQGYAAVLTVGDNQYEGGQYANFLESYDRSWGRFKSITRPTPGNHEYYTTGAAGYYRYFGARAGDPAKGYYAFQVGKWWLYALNCTGQRGAPSCAAGSAQEKWFRAHVAAHPSACKLAYWHVARFSSGSHGSSTVAAPLFKAAYDTRVDVVVNGHDHDYERFAKQTAGAVRSDKGVRLFVAGMGGKEERGFADDPARHSRVRARTAGVLQLTLHPTSYEWKLRSIPGETATDSGATACH